VCRYKWRRAGGIEDTTAVSMEAGINMRLSKIEMPEDERVVRALRSDSGTQLMAIGKKYAAETRLRKTNKLSVHCRCLMHMLFQCLALLILLYGLSGPLFCMCCLLHSGRNMRDVRGKIYAWIGERLEVVHMRPDDAEINSLFSGAVVNLLDAADNYWVTENQNNALPTGDARLDLP
jgi:hypothetical protein